MKRILFVILIGLLTAYPNGSAAANTMLPMDWKIFDQGDQEGPSYWLYDRGMWHQTSNIYGGQQDPSQPAKPGTFMVADDSDFSDGSVFVGIASDDDDAIGIMFRHRDEFNYYRFSMDKQIRYRRLIKLVDGVATVLAEDDFEYEKGRWYDLEIRLVGPVIQVNVDNQMIFNVADTHFKSGKLALYCWGNTQCQFRDIKIEPVKVAPPDHTISETPTPAENFSAGSGSMDSPQENPGEAAYIIGPGDILDISVWRDETLTNQLVVLPDGRISFPLIGEVMAAGKTLSELKSEMSTKLEAFVPNPELHLAIQGVSSMVIYLIGKVKSPGRYPMGQSLDVLEALAMAGGLTPFAKKKEIRIFLQNGENTEIFYFNYNEVAEGKRLGQNIELKRGM